MAGYKELKAQAEDLMRQAEAVRVAETAAVIADLKTKMAEYGITVADLGGSGKKSGSRKPVAAKYRNPASGQTWTGRGKPPKWLAALEATGRTRDEFAIQ